MVNKDGRISEVKKAIATTLGVNLERIALMDVYQSRFHREYSDRDETADIRDSDIVDAYELMPTPNLEEAPAGTSPVELIRIPILMRRGFTSSRHHSNNFGRPLVVTVPETVTYRELYAAVVCTLFTPSPLTLTRSRPCRDH